MQKPDSTMIAGLTESGLRYAVKRSGAAVAYCSLTIGCGTRFENGFHSGIAHFMEHTLFKGTARKKSSVINGYLDRLGGELNAYTTKEEIVLHATVLKEDLRKAASLLLEIATSATFPQNEIETERGVVIDEIKSYKDSPSEDIYDIFEEKLYGGHPLSKSILGTEESVSSISSEELREFYARGFRPERMAFSIVADIDEKKLEGLALSLAGKFFKGHVGTPESGMRQELVRLSNAFSETIDHKNNEANVIYGCYAPSLYEEQDRYAAILLCNILGGPASNSILNSVLRERNGWVYDVECSYNQYSDTGNVAISLGCDKENVEKCLKAVRGEIRKLQKTNLPEKRLAAAKKQLLGQLAISSDNGESQCLSMGKSLMAFGRIPGHEENVSKLGAVTADELRELACRMFDESRTSCLIMI